MPAKLVGQCWIKTQLPCFIMFLPGSSSAARTVAAACLACGHVGRDDAFVTLWGDLGSLLELEHMQETMQAHTLAASFVPGLLTVWRLERYIGTTLHSHVISCHDHFACGFPFNKTYDPKTPSPSPRAPASWREALWIEIRAGPSHFWSAQIATEARKEAVSKLNSAHCFGKNYNRDMIITDLT